MKLETPMKWTIIKRPRCDLCHRLAVWQHPLGGLRCAYCPKPKPKKEKC